MSLIALPPYGTPVPNTAHAVSVQMSTWNAVCAIALSDPEAWDLLRNGYPRSYIHKSIKDFSDVCCNHFDILQQKIMVFSSPGAAQACQAFLLAKNTHNQASVFAATNSLFCIGFQNPDVTQAAALPFLYCVAYSEEFSSSAASFWRLTRTGISSRLAERCLTSANTMYKVENTLQPYSKEHHPVHDVLCHRIATLIERSPIGPPRELKVAPEDVYLYESGMSAIYHIHNMLLDLRRAETVILGFTYELTLKVVETFGPSYKFYSAGDPGDIDNFEVYLEELSKTGKTIQAVWCECPSNPLLQTVDLKRVKQLAQKYDFIVVVDDTIGSFANVDVLGIADIVITSLTKSFSGYANVLAGSAVLNPNSRYYKAIKSSLNGVYVNNFHIDDAVQLEINSRDFLQRAQRMNDTAAYLVNYVATLVSKADSAVTNVYYPGLSWSAQNYRSQMRPVTDEFTPGYGGLFTIDFKTVDQSTAFLNSLDVHKGPSIGANITLALPYVQMVFQKEKEWASRHGVRETIIRISVGLEDKTALLVCLKRALMAANNVQLKG